MFESFGMLYPTAAVERLAVDMRIGTVKGGVMTTRTCIAVDLKSFYASVECRERGLDPLTTHLVVADESRTDKTICLAVSPSLKAYGLPGRCRLFEVRERLRAVNEERRLRAPGRRLVGKSFDAAELADHSERVAGLVIAKPRMSHYLRCSGDVYRVYLQYAAAEDIHVYSIDEVFIDATRYLRARGMTPRQMAAAIVRDVAAATGITATAGIGTNLYLAKVAMDIVAKHIPADADGVRVAELDEMSYRRLLWDHRPLTDFWRIGHGYARKLEAQGLLTMGDIARCSLGSASDYYNEDLLYRMFGVNAELLIDHAWGWEPCTIADIKAYRPEGHSISSGQVLQGPADFATARLIAKEMADTLALDLTAQGVLAGRVGLAVGYDIGNVDPSKLECASSGTDGGTHAYAGPVKKDRYGRTVPKPANGSIPLGKRTDSASRLREAMTELFNRLVDPSLMVRRITVVADDLHPAEASKTGDAGYEQPDLFSVLAADGEPQDAVAVGQVGDRRNDGVRRGTDDSGGRPGNAGESAATRERDIQQTLLDVKRKFGRNAVIKAMNMEPGATGQQRNRQIGGHAA